MTKTSAARAQNRTALPSSCSERTAWRGSQGGASWTMGWRGSRASSKQVLEWGSSEDTGERLNLAPPSPQALLLLVLHAGHSPCVRCTRGQTGPRSRLPLPQRMRSRMPGMMSTSLPSGPSRWPCHAMSHRWGRVAVKRGEQDVDVAISSGVRKAPHMDHSARRCVQPGLQLLLCTGTPLAGE